MKRIAIIGASTNKEKYGNKAVRAYKKAGWEVYPVNPHEKEVEGLTCYSSVRDIPVTIDTVSLYVPASISINLVKEFKEKGIKKAYVNPGAESDELIQALRAAGIEPLITCSITALAYEKELTPQRNSEEQEQDNQA